MKLNVIKSISIAVVMILIMVLIIFYGTAFVLYTTDPKEWPPEARFIVAIAPVIIISIMFINVLDSYLASPKMEYPLADLCDRLTIEQLKLARANANNSEYIFKLNTELKNRLKDGNISENSIDILFRSLSEINGKIWDLESDIRRGKENELGLAEVGRRAIKIRELNGSRIDIKNKIAMLINNPIELKFDHASTVKTSVS